MLSIKSLIDSSYLFLGYIQFANLIDNVIQGNIKSIDDYIDTIETTKLEYDKTKKSKKNVSSELTKNRLISIFSHNSSSNAKLLSSFMDFSFVVFWIV